MEGDETTSAEKAEIIVPLDANVLTRDELQARADTVIALCPLNAELREKFDVSAFAKMKASRVFINVARGELVKQGDLVKDLQNGDIRRCSDECGFT